ncbi:unnamed protein product [Tilletia controversa]|uniref:Sulfhydryl oxidase n=3 Tax=Tilletia TaxID=13289 RepID=A0A8X7SWT2_9BASI|nr:hypothetical protein CF336_g4468 [Tilletia laevis]KAE8192402.1 hypothetical protein CF328_g5379 [Tilletia controversa]KAE8260431.1 hypothetical protein A4X03_0g3822 [Tilletia caries]KAE8201812.1 hypothetical protein CF335_g3665 [Tilletia laevis]KAE8246930.1 hypothetical protein A4X06_0g4819 [Tilletia controversa]
MPTFSSKPIGPRRGSSGFLARVSPRISKHPILFFGLPFVITITASSFLLAQLTQTRYDYNATKVQTVTKEEELRMSKDRRRVDVREEYFRLSAETSEEDWDQWEPVRVPRPEGTPEWGVAPGMQATSAASSDPSKKRGWFGWLRPKPIEAEGRWPSEAQRREDQQRIPRSGSGQATDNNDEERRPSSLAPGVVLGPDGKPCRACNSKLAFAAAMKGTTGMGSPPKTKPVPAATTDAEGSNSSKTATAAAATQIGECPPDVEELGHATWTFLHSAAAYYPPNPSPAQQTSMRNLLQALPDVYPCSSCAQALSEEYAREKREGRGWEARDGITLESAVRGGDGRLSIWLCGLHNEVNARLGKPLFDCSEARLRQRWREGPPDGRCD